MRVNGPNGLIFHVSDDLGRALLATGGHQRVEDKPKAEPKPKK
jgi:hypothetical protein